MQLLYPQRLKSFVIGYSGYMSPEYAMQGKFSEKSDVYSFGVLMLEIVSGRKNKDVFDPENTVSLVGYVSSLNLISIFLVCLWYCFVRF